MGSHGNSTKVPRSAESLDSPEPPSKRRRVQGHKSSVTAIGDWSFTLDRPTQQSPMLVDAWMDSALTMLPTGLPDTTAELELDGLLPGSNIEMMSVETVPGESPRGMAELRSRSTRSPSIPLQYQPRESPFADCRDRFGLYPLHPFPIPEGGSADGYLKFRRAPYQKPVVATVVRRTPLTLEDEASGSESAVVRDTTQDSMISLVPKALQSATLPGASSSPALSASTYTLPDPESTSPIRLSSISSPLSVASQPAFRPDTGFGLTNLALHTPSFNNPIVSMDDVGMRLWNFYTNNFIPGRTVLKQSNLWMDFAGLCEVPSVRSAIQSYMGLYVYDFTGNIGLRHRINYEFNASEARMSSLLASPIRTTKEDSELITLCVILAMQDIVLPERRRKLPHRPRWVQSCLLAEEIIDARNGNGRAGREKYAQPSHLQLAHYVMVGRALILAEPMAALTHADNDELERQAKRFPWLLYGNMDEIHGGCGFSRKLLYNIYQVTWLVRCQASNPQDEGDWVMAADLMLDELQKLTQINTEGNRAYVAVGRQPIENIRRKPKKYLIETREEMTEVSAEAWRIAIIAYLQCRFYRLPRNHRDVVSTIDDLAECVRILPTSGHAFTAQAPLLPVIFLGILGTTSRHRILCRRWVKNVIQSPGRSSVPPLYRTLKKVWKWIDEEPTTPFSPERISPSISSRDPWWEYVVHKVQEAEKEIMCLT